MTIGDVLKESLVISTIEKVRHVVKKLRTNTVLNLLKLENLKKTILDCVTRWNSSYAMCSRLLVLKSFCITFSDDFEELHLSTNIWNQIDKMVTTLKPTNDTFMALQNKQLTMGDYYSAWTICKLKVQKIKNEFSEIFLTALDKRSEKIMKSDSMLACMYLDPRYQILLDTSQRTQAKSHLLKIYSYYITIF